MLVSILTSLYAILWQEWLHPTHAGLSLPLGILPPPLALTSVSSTGTVDNLGISISSRLPVMPPRVSHLPLLSPILPFPHHRMILMIFSPAVDSIPYRIVQRIQAGEFVDMRDLLANNISLHNQLEDLHGQTQIASTPASLRPRLREIPSLSSWMYCFAAYMTVRTGDTQTREMLAYCRLIIREALRHGSNGWPEYDHIFRCQAAIDSSLPWNTLVPGLQDSTLPAVVAPSIPSAGSQTTTPTSVLSRLCNSLCCLGPLSIQEEV